MNANYISVAEFQAAHPEIDISQYNTATISGFISEASRAIDEYCNVDGFSLQVITEEKEDAIVNNRGDLIIFPRVIPVQDVSEIKVKKGLTSLTLTLTQSGEDLFEIPTEGNKIIFPSDVFVSTGTFCVNSLSELRGLKFFTVLSYTAGYETIPPSIKRACALLVRDALSKKLNVAGASSVSQGGISIKYSESDGDSDDMLDAKNLLRGYGRIVA